MQMEDVIQQQQPVRSASKKFREYLPILSGKWLSLKLKGIRYLWELSDAWQWDLAYENRAWIEAESHWNEYDQMDMRG